jgi:RNA polymerase sigma-B factor
VSRPDTTDARLSLLHRPPTQRNLSDRLPSDGTGPTGGPAAHSGGAAISGPGLDERERGTTTHATDAEVTARRSAGSPSTGLEVGGSETDATRTNPAAGERTGPDADLDRPSTAAGDPRFDTPEDAGNGPQVTDPRVDHRLVLLAEMPSTDPRYGALRRTIIEAHLPLVHHLAQRFRGRGEPYDDLVQVGTIGLLHSVDRFDPGRGSFAAFAVPTIVGEIRRHFRDRGWAMRIPRRVQDLGRRVSEARETLTHNLDRSPTVQEIAAYLEVDADLVLEALETATAYITVPLPTTADESDRMAKAFEDSGLELVEQRETLRPLLAQLPAREQRILELRFARGMSQSQIATEVGVSQMHVSRLLAKSLAVLRSGLTEEL